MEEPGLELQSLEPQTKASSHVDVKWIRGYVCKSPRNPELKSTNRYKWMWINLMILNVCVPPKFPRWDPNTQSDGVSEAFGEVIRMSEISAPTEASHEHLSSFCHVTTQQEACGPEEQLAP